MHSVMGSPNRTIYVHHKMETNVVQKTYSPDNDAQDNSSSADSGSVSSNHMVHNNYMVLGNIVEGRKLSHLSLLGYLAGRLW